MILGKIIFKTVYGNVETNKQTKNNSTWSLFANIFRVGFLGKEKF